MKTKKGKKSERRRLDNYLRPYKYYGMLVDAWVRYHDPNQSKERSLNWAHLKKHHNVQAPYSIAKPFVESDIFPDVSAGLKFAEALTAFNASRSEKNVKDDADIVNEVLGNKEIMKVIRILAANPNKRVALYDNDELPIVYP